MKKIYLFLILIPFIGCEKDEIISPNLEPNLTNQIQSQFSLSKYDDEYVKDNLKVNWYQVPETELDAEFYEFSTNINSVLQKESSTMYYKYTVIANSKENNKWEFHIVKFTTFDSGKLQNVSLKNLGDFTGTIHQYNFAGILQKIEALKEGKIISTYKGDPAFLKNAGANYYPTDWPNPSDAGRWARITTSYYTDYWVNYYNSLGQLSGLRYTGSYRYNVRTEYIYVPANQPAPGMGSQTGYNSYHQHQEAPHGPAVNQNPHPYEEILEEDEAFEERIDDSNLDDCVKNILDSLKTHNHGIGEFLYKFAGNDIGYVWNVESDVIGNQVAASTDSPSFYNGSITTVFDTRTYDNATDLSWVKTILHESAHAYLATYYARERPDFIGTYPEMVEDWGRLQNWNDVHHEEFARSLVNDIAIILKEYGQMNGYNLSDQFYNDLAWGGLQETNAFNQNVFFQRTRILNTIKIELTGKNLNGSSQNQKGNDAGC